MRDLLQIKTFHESHSIPFTMTIHTIIKQLNETETVLKLYKDYRNNNVEHQEKNYFHFKLLMALYKQLKYGNFNLWLCYALLVYSLDAVFISAQLLHLYIYTKINWEEFRILFILYMNENVLMFADDVKIYSSIYIMSWKF